MDKIRKIKMSLTFKCFCVSKDKSKSKLFFTKQFRNTFVYIFQINGKRGFVNRRHLQETRVKERNLGYVAPPHYTYYEMQLGGPDAAAHMQQRQQQMQVNNILQMPMYVLTIMANKF